MTTLRMRLLVFTATVSLIFALNPNVNQRYKKVRSTSQSTERPLKHSAENANHLPCCKDTNSGTSCRLMYMQSEIDFKHRCEMEPDFSLVGCCKTCNLLGIPFRVRATRFFSGKNASLHCFDRMSPEFCSRFDNKKDIWTTEKWNCDTSQSLIAFRVCRATCGFCDLDWMNASESKTCYKQ